MQHTMVIACVTVISEPLGKLPIRLVRRLGNGGSVVAVKGRVKTGKQGGVKAARFAAGGRARRTSAPAGGRGFREVLI
jgi:hypothetical protein